MGARETALNALIACRVDGAWVNEALKECTARDRLDSRDAALASRICYGVVQNRMRLDFFLNRLYHGKRLHPIVRDLLHMGLYQIYDMDRIPESAAVNESVALTRKYCPGQPKAPGLVNGILRSAIRTKGTIPEPTSYEEKYSHPAELISLLKRALPKGTLETMLIADNQAPPPTVQVNTLKTTSEEMISLLAEDGVQAQVHPWCPDSLILHATGRMEQLRAFRQGLLYVQDPASRLSVLCAQLPQTGGRVLDCCAAPGGKSFAAALAMKNRGEILSCDIHPHKVTLIQSGAERLGFTSIRPLLQDAASFVPAWEKSMDAVLADVPCSGLGIIRKKPDIRYKNLEETEQLPMLQLKILRNVSRYVRPGGTLMYSTCTVLPRENEEVVERFLQENSDFRLQPLSLPAEFEDNHSGMLPLIPGQHDTDGFFICRMRRKL